MAWSSSGFGAIRVGPPRSTGVGAWAVDFAVVDGPVLAGHYPFDRVVPGAALLDAALALYGATAPGRIADFKLLRPVRPGEGGFISLRPLDGPEPVALVEVHVEAGVAARLRLIAAPASATFVPETLVENGARLDVAALPHASPMLLVDTARRHGASAVTAAWAPAASALASIAPDWGRGNRAVPIALALESFLQAGALLFDAADLRTSAVLLGSVRDVTVLRRPSAAPLRHHVHLIRQVGASAIFGGTTEQDGEVVLRCDGVTAALKARPAAATPLATAVSRII